MKCISCKKKVKKMRKPYEGNYSKGVDILLYPHYGSIHAEAIVAANRNGSAQVRPLWGVICDDCYGKIKKGLSNR